MIVLEPKIYSFEQLMELEPWLGSPLYGPSKEDLEIALKKHNRTIFLNEVSEEKLPNEEIKVMWFNIRKNGIYHSGEEIIGFFNENERKKVDEYEKL